MPFTSRSIRYFALPVQRRDVRPRVYATPLGTREIGEQLGVQLKSSHIPASLG